MAHRSQSSSIGDNPLDPNYLPPHYREEYRLAIDALIESDTQGYQEFLKSADLVSFLAPPEIDYIKNSIKAPNLSSSIPELTYHEGATGEDGSSDTYWPMQSDLAAPGLDLGWPLPQHSFAGPTEVTTLVNPCDPDMPSIKEQARRLIKNARQVIAVVMDMFTDVDIFSDLLEAAARHVPVYILLDEQDAHHFVSMAINCKVNLDLIHMMRIRTVAGITYYSRTGKSFKGQVKDRFLLADCRAVLSGNYSFMWSFEKIHRCIAHLFLGELVATFDEEFRILFAQSEPLSIDPSIVPLATDTSSFLGNQFSLKRSQSLRNPMGFLRQPDISSTFPYGDPDRNPVAHFRRNDPFRHTIEPGAGITIGKYSHQQFRLQQSFLEQGRSIVSRQLEMNTFKRHSYAEGTQENYSSSRQYMKHRLMNNLEETDFHREQSQSSLFFNEGPGSGHGHLDRLRGLASQPALDKYSDSNFRPDMEPYPGNLGRDCFSSDDLRPEGLQSPPVAGRYDGASSGKRPTVGHAYACQSSPTHPHPPEKKPSHKKSDQERDEDSSIREGLRSWRINSYLSTCEDTGEEGLVQPMGPDAFEDPSPSQQPSAAETLAPYFSTKDKLNLPKPRPDILRPRFGKPIAPDSSGKDCAPTTKDPISSFTEYKSMAVEKSERWVENDRERDSQRGGGRELGVDMETKEAPDIFMSKHESFRSRVNPLLQRSSRLRSSLIFSSSKAEMHSGSLGLQPATEEDEGLDTVRTSSIVAQILEKRRSMSREPFDWRKKAEEKKEKERKEIEEKERQRELTKRDEEGETEMEIVLKDRSDTKYEPPKICDEVTAPTTDATSAVTTDINMNDPASRLQYFKDLAAKRKVSRMGTETSQKAPQPPEKKTELADRHLSSSPPKIPVVSISPAEPVPEPKKADTVTKIADLSHRPSKPVIISAKPPPIHLKPQESSTHREEGATEGSRKELFKSLKPLHSPKIFKRDPLKLKGLNPRRISCGEEVLTTDATDAEKTEMKKSRSHSSATMPMEDSKEGHHKVMGSNASINTLGGEGKGEGKTLDFLKKQTQRLKGFLGPKDKDKKSTGDDRTMATVIENADDSRKKSGSSSKDMGSSPPDHTTANHKTSSAGISGPSRYQTPNSSVLFNSNLRDDTKVILEQISANSQKARHDREESGGESETGAKGLERQNSMKRNRFLRPPGNTQEREGLLKRIESLRKEKKVYSRFEMGNSLA